MLVCSHVSQNLVHHVPIEVFLASKLSWTLPNEQFLWLVISHELSIILANYTNRTFAVDVKD